MIGIWKASGLALQLAASMVALAVIAFSPPERGRMILLPMLGIGGGAALQVALRHGAGLAGRGPFPGSIVISGDLSRLASPMRAAGVLLLAAPRGCGENKQ